MNRTFKLFWAFIVLLGVASASAAGTLVILSHHSREQDSAAVNNCAGLFEIIGEHDAVFSDIRLSGKSRYAVLMLTRAPNDNKELAEKDILLDRLSASLEQGNYLYVINDSGDVLLKRDLPRTLKIFDINREIDLLKTRLNGKPVLYFPSESLRGRSFDDFGVALQPAAIEE